MWTALKELRIDGRGGQGIVVGVEILSNAFLNEGKYLAVMPSYGVERRGSDVTAYGRLSDKPVREKSMSYHPDYLVIFDPSQVSKPSTYTAVSYTHLPTPGRIRPNRPCPLSLYSPGSSTRRPPGQNQC